MLKPLSSERCSSRSAMSDKRKEVLDKRAEVFKALNLHKQLCRLRQTLVHSADNLQEVSRELNVGGKVMDEVGTNFNCQDMMNATSTIFETAHQLLLHAEVVEKEIADMICPVDDTSSDEEEPDDGKEVKPEEREEQDGQQVIEPPEKRQRV